MKSLTSEQEEHRVKLAMDAMQRCYLKYEKGAIEHNSNLWEFSKEQLLDWAIDEAIDQINYLLTLKEKMGEKGK